MSRRHLATVAVVLLLPLLIWAAVRDPDEDGPSSPAEIRAERVARGEVVPEVFPASVPRSAAELLRQGRPWRAARVLRESLGADAPPEAVVVHARAEAGAGQWERARRLLEGEPWLDTASGGAGWFWLARAREEAEEWGGAADAYARFLRAGGGAAGDTLRPVAEVRRGLALLRAGSTDEGVRMLEEARGHVGPAAGWVGILAAEAVAAGGDTARARMLASGAGETASSLRAHQARVRAHREAGDHAGARSLARAFRDRAATDEERAALGLDAARASLALDDAAAARQELVAAMLAAPATEAAGEAARLLATQGGITPPERMLMARVRDRRGANATAAADYAAWLAANVGTEEERFRARLAMGQALFDAGEYARAEAALRPLADAPAHVAAPALYTRGRAQYRSGSEAAARATLLSVPQRFPRHPSAAEALWLVGDLAHDAGNTAQAAALFRRLATEHPASGRAPAARMRLGGLEFLARRWGPAAAVWEAGRARGREDPGWAQATYWAGRAYLAAGDTARARERFREVRAGEPVSYYAVQAARRLGEEPWPLDLPDAPREDAALRTRVETSLGAVDVLRAAGLEREAGAEVERLVAQAGDDRPTLYALAEALNRRDYTIHAVRIGQRLQRENRRWDDRLLRILYPFPFRETIAAEARERGLDPFLVAALTRQESTFRPGVASPVGARGLMQVMPATGRGLARSAGIAPWDPELLYNPEINVHLGTRFLADQMRRWDRRLPDVFAAYNAGPGRVVRWRRWPEARDAELFTERIPFAETQDYVKILTRNIALYRGLYGQEARGGD